MKNVILQGDALTKLKELPEQSVNMCMTSPPYWALRDYGTAKWEGGDEKCDHLNGTLQSMKTTLHPGTNQNDKRNFTGMPFKDICGKCGAERVDKQLGLEPTFDQYINDLCDIFDGVKRVLRDDGTCWVNLGDSYYGSGGTAGQKEGTKNLGYDTHKMGAVSQNKLRKTRTDCKQTNVSFSTKKKFCCNCGKQFDAMPGQYFCDGACAGVDNTPRELKGEMQSKCLIGIPMRFALEMINRGWILRNTIIWHKPNCMPSSVKDRFTVDFEYIFLFSKKKKYYFKQQLEPVKKVSIERMGRKWCGSKHEKTQNFNNGQQEIKAEERMDKDRWCNEKGRNKRCVWDITLRGFSGAHFAVYPEKLCETPIKAGCPVGGSVLDPFAGAFTTGVVANKQNKNAVLIELNPEYIEIGKKRLASIQQELATSFLKKESLE